VRVAIGVIGLTLSLCACASPLATPATQHAFAGSVLRAGSFGVTPFNAPSSVFPGETSTEPTGIRPLLITATVTLSNGTTQGGLYIRERKTWTPIVYPGAESTAAYGPESIAGGYRVVGSYKNPGQKAGNGFVYDSVANTYATLDVPARACAPITCTGSTIPHSVLGDRQYLVVGNYDDSAQSPAAGHAFLYDSASQQFRTIDVNGAVSTTAYGIWVDGKHVAVAGGYTDKAGRHAYVRDVATGKLLAYDYPGAAVTHFEGITGAGGPGNYSLAGDYTKPRSKAVYGFFLNVRNWIAWPPIVIGKLSANSVSVRDVVGVYNPGGGVSGFITTLPVQDPP
jgi:hypothetical protein